jgi:hypothetical protein
MLVHINATYNSKIQYYRLIIIVVGAACQPDHDQQHCYHHALTVKPEAATAVVELLKTGVRTPETC